MIAIKVQGIAQNETVAWYGPDAGSTDPGIYSGLIDTWPRSRDLGKDVRDRYRPRDGEAGQEELHLCYVRSHPLRSEQTGYVNRLAATEGDVAVLRIV